MTGLFLHRGRVSFCGCVVAGALFAACDARDQGAVGGGMASVAPKVLFQAKQGGPWWPNGLYVTPGDHFLCASFSGDPGQSAVYLYDLASRSLSAGVDSDRRWIPLADAPEAGVMLAALKGEDLCRGVLRPGHAQLLDINCLTTTSGLATHLRAETTYAVCHDDMVARVVLLDLRDWSVHGSVVVPDQFTVMAAHDNAGLIAVLGCNQSPGPDGDASADRVEVRLIKVASGEVEATCDLPAPDEKEEGAPLFLGSCSGDGNALLLIRVGARERSYHVVRRVEGEWLPSVTIQGSGLQSAVALNDDSSRLACFRLVDPEKEQASLMIWSLDPLEMVREVQLGGVVWVRELVFSRDGRCIFLVDDKNRVGEIRLDDLGGV